MAGQPSLGEHLGVQCGGIGIGGGQLVGAVDLAHAKAGTLTRGLDDQRQAQLGYYRCGVVVGVQRPCRGDRQAQSAPHCLAAQFVHAQRRAEHAAAGVGQAKHLQRALDDAVFTTAAVQHIEHPVKTAVLQLCQQRIGGVDRVRVDAQPQQCLQHRCATV